MKRLLQLPIRTRIVEKQTESADILLFTDDEGEAGRIADVIADMGYVCRTLHFKDSVNSVLTPPRSNGLSGDAGSK